MSNVVEVTRSWDAYVKEAARPDFVLKAGEKEIRFTNPTGTALMRITQGIRAGDMEVILLGLAGDSYPQMRELLAGAGHEALSAVVEDLMEHFHLYDETQLQSPNGDRTLTLTRPTDIRAKLREGWRPLGEPPALLS